MGSVKSHREKRKRIHRNLLLGGIPLSLLQWTAIVLAILWRSWGPVLVWAVIAIPAGIVLSVYYFRRVAYLCPQCHEVFRPTLREAFFARHTVSARNLTCPHCHHHGFCVEVAGEDPK